MYIYTYMQNIFISLYIQKCRLIYAYLSAHAQRCQIYVIKCIGVLKRHQTMHNAAFSATLPQSRLRRHQKLVCTWIITEFYTHPSFEFFLSSFLTSLLPPFLPSNSSFSPFYFFYLHLPMLFYFYFFLSFSQLF